MQTQSGNPNRPENSSSAEFSSTDEEINARFQILRQSSDRRRIPNRSATPTRVVPSTVYNPRQDYSPVRRNVIRCPTLCSLCTVHSRGEKEKTKRVFCNKKRKERRKILRRDINQKKMESMRRNIKNLSNNELTRNQITLLSRGLKFIPTPVPNEDHIRRQLLNDHRAFARRLRLKYIFHGQNKEPYPFHVKSNWEPPIQPSVALETYLEEVKTQLADVKIITPKNNLPFKEWQAIKEL